MIEVRLESIMKKFGDMVAVDHVTVTIPAGELFFLLGPSGCGKTTCLRIVAGFYPPDDGRICFGPRVVTHLAPHLRNTGMVFQNYALFPHMTVEKNVAYGLKVRGLSASDRKTKTERVLQIVQMSGMGKKLPNQLSGGQQQRVALARALVIEPDVLLLDEPLSNLDAKLRLEMREEIKRIHRETGVTAIYVTHDQKEALSIADRLAVMRDGRIEQIGTPQEVYNRPANAFVAGFIGETNFIPCEVIRSRPDEVQLDSPWGTIVSSKPHGHLPTEQKIVASIRPEAIQVMDGGMGPNPSNPATLLWNYLHAKVKAITYLGDQQQYVLSLSPELEVKASLQHPGAQKTFPVGAEVTLVITREDVAVFDDPSHNGEGVVSE